MLEPEPLLLELARAEKEDFELLPDLELEILERALKDCLKNRNAWLANERNGHGKTATNKAGAERYRQKAQQIESRIKELQGHTA